MLSRKGERGNGVAESMKTRENVAQSGMRRRLSPAAVLWRVRRPERSVRARSLPGSASREAWKRGIQACSSSLCCCLCSGLC